jgi:hypothetical protein
MQHTSSTIEIKRETESVLPGYASMSIAFEAREAIDVRALDRESKFLPTRPVTPHIQDSGALPHNDPASRPRRSRISNWPFLIAYLEGAPACRLYASCGFTIAESRPRGDCGSIDEAKLV